jgi:UDP-3-O-[3-hydroxymyristoyl] glucosamine N-acyltransferase
MPGLAIAQDACPDDPAKLEPGLCGCGVADTDLDADGESDACVDETAVVDPSAFIGFAARIGPGAQIGASAQVLANSTVGAGATIEGGATVSVRASVGVNATIGANAIVSRGATIGASAVVGSDSVVGRLASWGANTTSVTAANLGYGSTLGADSVLGSNVVIGNLASIGDRLDAADGVVIARSVALGDDVVLGQGTVLGPEVQLGTASTTGVGVRIRKGSVFGDDAQLGAGARIGRGAQIGRSARIGSGAVLRAHVTGGVFATVDSNTNIPRSTNLGDGIAAPTITSFAGPASLQFEPTVLTGLSVAATDPQDLSLTTTWSFVGDASGWSFTDPNAASTSVVPPGPTGGTESVTARAVVSNGIVETEQTVELSLFAQASCWAYADPSAALPSRDRGDALYFVSPTGAVADAVEVWCDQTTQGGGWMLVSDRPGSALGKNVEDCGSTLDDFFTLGCGVPNAGGTDASYALPTTIRVQFTPTAWYFEQSQGGSVDTDDASILYSSADLLAPSVQITDRRLDRACSLDGVCDHEDLIFRYTGTGWFGNSLCGSSFSTVPYYGNYAVCHAGASVVAGEYAYPSGLLFGDRYGYDESKLWNHESGDARNWTERIYLTTKPAPPVANGPPVINATSVPTVLAAGAASTSISVAAADPEGDTLTYRWRMVYGGSQWVLANSTQATATLQPPAPASGGAFVTVEVSVFDGQGNVANEVFTVDRGTHTSCQSLYQAGVTASGVYSIDPQNDGNSLEVYCEQDLFGGGWTLISNRAEDTSNIESCGSRVRDFFSAGCGSTAAIGGADSYALTALDRNRLPKSQMMVLHYDGGVADFDDGVRIDLGSLSDPFPDTSGSVVTSAVSQICGADGSNCDSSGTYWLYAGDGWFASSQCSAAYDTGPYRGNYGYCVSGMGPGSSNNLSGGNRAGYQETKLWAYNSNIGDAYQERIFYR